MSRILKSNLSETLILLITSVALIFPQISFATLAEENKELGPRTSLKFPPETFHTIIDKVARNSSKRRMAINIKLALTNSNLSLDTWTKSRGSPFSKSLE